MPEVPEMPAVREYLPDVTPYLPDIPVPEQITDMKSQVESYDTEIVSPLIRRVNHLILLLSLTAIILSFISDGLESVLIFKPSMIISINPQEKIP